MTEDQAIGLRVKRLRGPRPQQSLALSMKALGRAGSDAHKWTQDTVTQVETGKRRLRLAEAAVLARVLGVPMEALVTDGPIPPASVPAALHELDLMREYIESRITELQEVPR
jgi:hypothetical protein